MISDKASEATKVEKIVLSTLVLPQYEYNVKLKGLSTDRM